MHVDETTHWLAKLGYYVLCFVTSRRTVHNVCVRTYTNICQLTCGIAGGSQRDLPMKTTRGSRVSRGPPVMSMYARYITPSRVAHLVLRL